MKLKRMFFILYGFALVYCYHLFVFSETPSLDLSIYDKVIVVILVVLLIILFIGFKIKKDIQE